MAVLGKAPPAISPLSALPAKHPPPMTQTPADPATATATATAAAGDASDAAPSASTSAEAPVTVTATIALPAQALRKTASSTSVLSDKAPDTPGSSTSSSAPRQRKYERKTKRFIWPDELHRLFVAAIFDVGLKNASPKALLALMGSAGPNAGLTTEHLKSHLQKYRLNYERSRQEFLDFYDQSAKKNLKRRRKQANRSSDHNTMFVFPIVPNESKRGLDSDDESGDDADESMSMSDSAQSEQPTPRDSINDKDRTASFSELLKRAERNKTQRGRTGSLQPQLGMDEHGSNQDRPRFGSVTPTSAAELAAQSYAAAQASSAHQKRALASKSSVAAGLQYGFPVAAMASNIVPGSMNVMTDPQWNLLNSMMMSPHLVGMAGNPSSQQMQFPTSEGMSAPGGNPNDFALATEEPTDLQMQMHMAMQAHMNLHRQMLTRKVEVSQHAVAAQTAAAANATFGNQAQYHHQQKWSNKHMPPSFQQRQQAMYAQSIPTSYAQDMQHVRRSITPQEVMVDPQQTPAPLNILPRPSVSAPSPVPVLTSEARSDTVTSMVSTQSIIDEVMAEDTAIVHSGTNVDARPDDEAMDLYRWDRIDLNVDLDDDDLFGFLKS